MKSFLTLKVLFERAHGTNEIVTQNLNNLPNAFRARTRIFGESKKVISSAKFVSIYAPCTLKTILVRIVNLTFKR